MKNNQAPIIPYHRKKSGKTNYKKRLKLLLSEKMRLVIRRSNKNMLGQIIEYHPDGDKVLLTTTSQELTKLGWKYGRKNIPASYLTGLLLAKKAKEKKVKEAILDVGLQTSVSGGRLYAFLKGVVEGGVHVPHNDKILPSAERLSGQHVAQYVSKAQGNQFARYKKENSTIDKAFNEIKQKIIGK